MAPPCLVPHDPGDVSFPWAWWGNERDSSHQQTLRWAAKNEPGYPWGLSGRYKTFWCILGHAGRAAGTQACPHRHQQWTSSWKRCAHRKTEVSSLFFLLLCCFLKTEMVRRFIEILCSGFRRGGKVAVQQEHTVNVKGVGQANSLTWTSRVLCTAFRCSMKGD